MAVPTPKKAPLAPVSIGAGPYSNVDPSKATCTSTTPAMPLSSGRRIAGISP
jgi:hypothetical protein